MTTDADMARKKALLDQRMKARVALYEMWAAVEALADEVRAGLKAAPPSGPASGAKRIILAESVAQPMSERARRGFANAAGMTFGLLKAEVLAVEGGWRDARMLDGDFEGWLCPHVHATAQEAMDCPEKESLLKYPPGHPGEK